MSQNPVRISNAGHCCRYSDETLAQAAAEGLPVSPSCSRVLWALPAIEYSAEFQADIVLFANCQKNLQKQVSAWNTDTCLQSHTCDIHGITACLFFAAAHCSTVVMVSGVYQQSMPASAATMSTDRHLMGSNTPVLNMLHSTLCKVLLLQLQSGCIHYLSTSGISPHTHKLRFFDFSMSLCVCRWYKCFSCSIGHQQGHCILSFPCT